MRKEWNRVPFESLYAEPSRNGLMRPKRVRGEGYPMINMGELFAYERIDGQPMDLVPMSGDEIEKYSVRNGDLLFARQSLVAEGTGKCSVVLRVRETTTFESHLIRVRLDRRKAEPLFYHYYFSSPAGRANVQSIMMQVAAAGIRASELALLRVPEPPLVVQATIASILSTYDSLIENDRRRIKILEEMVQTIYQEWFVEFRVPGVKLRKATPAEKKAFGKNVFPEGWELRRATDVMLVDPALKVAKDTEGPFVPMSSLEDGSMVIESVERRRGASGSRFQNGDTLFARITPCLENGKTGFVQFLPTADAVASGSTEFIVLRSKTVCPEFVYLLARSEGFRNNAIKSMTGATGRQRVQEECFDKFPVARPDDRVLAMFRESVGPMFAAIQSVATQNDNLRRTRDVLLPRLISGEVTVDVVNTETGDGAVDEAAEVPSSR